MVSDLSFLGGSAAKAAPRLLGCILEREIGGRTVRARIVETEAYDQSDVASHSFAGRTPRTEVMFGPPGRLYVYFTYGMHYCCNVTVGAAGYGAAVLIRAVEPLDGIEVLEDRRHVSGVSLTNGPAKMCQALGIDTALNGHDLVRSPLTLIAGQALTANEITRTTRIGLSKGQDTPWRFYETGNPYVSRPR